jgi:hypothetical protein
MITRQTLSYIDYMELDKAVQAKCGKDTRNWAGKSYKSDDLNYTKPYQDFWHKLIDVYEGNRFHNDCYIQISFQDIWQYFRDKEWDHISKAYAEQDGVELDKEWIWIKEVCDVFEAVLKENGIEPDETGCENPAYNFYISW